VIAAPWFTLSALAVVIIGKPLAAAIVLLVLRYSLHAVITVAVTLGQIGEFSFILAALARDLGIMPASGMATIVAVSIASITLSPLLSYVAPVLETWITKHTRWRSLERRSDTDERGASSSLNPRDRAVVVGYGPTGRTVARLLRDNDISPTIIELNMDTVRELQQQGRSAVYGNASHNDTLVTAGVRHADTLIVSGADNSASETIRIARELNPALHVFVRGAYLRDVPALRSAGAEQVFSGEGEVALAMTEAVLRRLGATPEQIDRERERVHAELFGGPNAPGQPAG
jgi:CPA2 family monovalent cation:H+ antiporter-2